MFPFFLSELLRERKHCFPLSENFKRTLFLEGKLESSIAKNFEKNQTNADRVRFCYQLMKDRNLLPCGADLRAEKNDAIANNIRATGNKKFKEGKHVEALELYNGALCHAQPGDIAIALAYANRSAIYLKYGFYKFCLENIELALANFYPDDLKPKLLARKSECELMMKGKIDSMMKYNPWPVKLSYPANPKIPYVIDAMKYDGKRVVATRDLKPGDIIMNEPPFSKMLFEEALYSHCYNCLKCNFLNLKPCPKSTKAMFCSDKCAEEAWNRFYKFEYTMINGMHDWFEKVSIHGIRSTILAFTMVKSTSELRKLIDSIDTKKENSFTVDHTAGEKECFRALYSLEPHQDRVKDTLLFDYTTIAAIMYHMMKEFTDMKKIILETRKDDDLFMEILMRLLQISNVYIHAIDRYVRNEEPNPNPFARPIYKDFAHGITLAYSMFNHSCAPNVQVLYNLTIVQRPIKAGEEITINVGLNHWSYTREVRQKELKEKYCFDCHCEACEKNYPLAKDAKNTDCLPYSCFIDTNNAVFDTTDYSEMSRKKFQKLLKKLSKALVMVHPEYPCQGFIYVQTAFLRCIQIMYHDVPLDYIFEVQK